MMLERILEFSIRQRALVLLASGILVALGAWQALHLPIDAVPDITGVQVQVNTEVAGLAPEEAEKMVTWPIETELAGLPGLTEMRSITKSGLSQVTLQFTDRTDVHRARQQVLERLQSAQEHLPAGTNPRLAPISTGLGEVFYFTVEYEPDATNRPPTRYEQLLELTDVLDFVVKPQLRSVRGIAEVNRSGGYDRQFVLEPDPAKLRAANITFAEFADAIAANLQNAGGGIIHSGEQQWVVRGVTRARDEREILDLPLKFGGGVRSIRVEDVAEVRAGHASRYGAATVDGEEAVIGTAMMLSGENSRLVAQRVAARVERIKDTLPPGVVVRPLYDRADLVDRTVGTVRKNLFEGAVLVVVVLLALLGNWRAALIVSAAIPLSFLCALLGMNRLGISGNLMSLGAVDFGLIIDGAVVMVENIVRQLGHRQAHLGRALTPAERVSVVLQGGRQVARPMFFGVLIIAVVYLPILALTGIEGKMFRPMALTVMLALGGALVLALTLMPVLCSFLLRGTVRETDNALVRIARRVYEPVLDFAMRRRATVAVAALGLVAGSVLLFQRLGAEFVPTLDEGSTTIMIYHPAGLSVEAGLDRQKLTDRRIREQFPEVERVFTRSGTSEVATDPMPPNEIDFYVEFHPRSEWRPRDGRVPTKEELAGLIGASIEAQFPDCHVLIAQPIEMRFNELLEGVRADVSVKVFGNDYDVLEKLAEQIKPLLEATQGAGEVEYETEGRADVLEIQVRREALARHSLGAAAVNETITTALAGRVVGTLAHGEHPHDVVVRMSGERRDRLEEIRDLPVRVGEHGMVALGDLAALNKVQSVEPIQRDSGHRRAALLVNLDTADVEGWVRRAQAAIAREVLVPEGYRIEFGGQFENLMEAKTRLAYIVPATLLAIFVLIMMAFDSWRQAALVYTGIPLALTGGVASLWLRGMPFSITAAVGFIALSGVAVLNGVMLVSCFNQLREEGRTVPVAVREGVLLRLRPVLITAAVASFGFVPMALSTGLGAEVQRPLATVVIGGILSSTFLTLVLLPALYAWLERPQAGASAAETAL